MMKVSLLELSGPISFTVFGPGATGEIYKWTLFQKRLFKERGAGWSHQH